MQGVAVDFASTFRLLFDTGHREDGGVGEEYCR